MRSSANKISLSPPETRPRLHIASEVSSADGFDGSLNLPVATLYKKKPYTNVHCLLLKWEGHDLEGLEEEVRELQNFLEELAWTTTEFDIPCREMQDPEARLSSRIESFINDHGRDPNNLLLIYYAGHGSNNIEGFPQWRPQRESHVYLNWARPMHLLLTAQADVLIVLDCCHAAMAARGGSRFQSIELLAASAMNAQTPAPGPDSFTRHFITVLRESLKRTGLVDTRKLHSQLAKAYRRLQATPILFDIAQSNAPSIILRPLPGSSLSHYEPHSKMTIEIDINHPLGRHNMVQETLDWLKRSRMNAPRGIGEVRFAGEKKTRSISLRSYIRLTQAVNRISNRRRLISSRRQLATSSGKIFWDISPLTVYQRIVHVNVPFVQYWAYGLLLCITAASLFSLFSCLFLVDCRSFGSSLNPL